MGYNVARNLIGAVPNVPIASDPGKELNPPIFSTLAIHGGQVKIQREEINNQQLITFCPIFPPVPSNAHIEVDWCQFEVKVIFNELLEH